MSAGGLDHIGIAVSKIEDVLPVYRDGLKLPVLEEEVVEGQGVRVLKLDAGGTHIELIEPLSEESPVAKFIAKNGEGIHHICFDVADAQTAGEEIRAQGFRTIGEEARPGASNRMVIFMHPKDAHGVLIELSSPGE
ncbi:MAG: methylmalonyl-CoA epimerase [Planctomycetota bacterium]|jgi:methylmalonyl-CoA/ethylmalonyl-CoA epimerase